MNERASVNFSIDDLYAYTKDFSALFPRDQHVREKMRQIMQKLRDDGFLSFQGGGRYALNLAYQELSSDPAPLRAQGVEFPAMKQVIRNIRLRSTLLGAEIKRRYKNTCQVCRKPVPLVRDQYYAEAHHLWPLGSPHCGPDVSGNIIVLCPKHHVMFDRGAATILPDELMVKHVVEDVFPKHAFLYLEPWHILNQKCLKYHHHEIFGRELLINVRQTN